jgi:hypothetical protein
MKDTIQYLEQIAKENAELSEIIRSTGDHITATIHEKRARHIRRIIRMAIFIYLPSAPKSHLN